MIKISEVLNSRNALVSVVSIFLLAMSTNDILVSENADQVIDMFSGKTGAQVVTLLFLNFFSPLSKLISKITSKQFSYDFLKSDNFRTQAVTLVIGIAGMFMSEDTAVVFGALIVHAVNFVLHLIRPSKTEPTDQSTPQVETDERF